jgi:CheY-like chemotaxis protein
MEKILVIDDEPDIIDYLEALLEDNDYKVISASNGEEGLVKARTELPDLITLDITMPGKSGTEVFRQLRMDEKTRNIPVFIITGVMDFRQFIYQRAIEPPEGYMEKPIDPNVLLTSISRILAGEKIRAESQDS